jgi:hypothetical protein
MEPGTTVLRKDVAGWVAEGAVNCKRCARVRSVHWRGCEIHASGTGCLQNANHACAEKNQGVLGGLYFLSVFWIPVCYLLLSFVSLLPFFLLTLLLFLFKIYFYRIRFCVHLSVKCIKPAVFIMSALSH